MISTRAISPHEWAQYKEVRLKALKDSPDAFGSTWEAESTRSDESWLSQLNQTISGTTDQAIFAFKDEYACGMVWCKLHITQADIANIYQMWVAPGCPWSWC